MQQCRVLLLIVDEVEHITHPNFRRRLLEISNLTKGVPIICASCNPHRWTEGDDQSAGRWNDCFYLEQYKGQLLNSLLGFFELLLPFGKPSLLPERTLNVNGSVVDGPAKLIEQWTGGVMRDIMILIIDASTRAIERGQVVLQSSC